jgi:hypothetical protein
MEKVVNYKEEKPLDSEMPLSVQPSYGIGIVDSAVSEDNMTDEEDTLTKRRLDMVLMPLLGFCYMLQFLDKATLSYSSLLGIVRDTVSTYHRKANLSNKADYIDSISLAPITPGSLVSSILDICFGLSRHLTSWFAYQLANTSPSPSAYGVLS